MGCNAALHPPPTFLSFAIAFVPESALMGLATAPGRTTFRPENTVNITCRGSCILASWNSMVLISYSTPTSGHEYSCWQPVARSSSLKRRIASISLLKAGVDTSSQSCSGQFDERPWPWARVDRLRKYGTMTSQSSCVYFSAFACSCACKSSSFCASLTMASSLSMARTTSARRWPGVC
jgi:hypothetical protein